MNNWTYDEECLPNCFMATFKKLNVLEFRRFLIYHYNDEHEVNQLKELVDFAKGTTLISFNGFHYDDILLNYCIDKLDSLLKKTPSEVTSILCKVSDAAVNYDMQSPTVKKEIRRLKYMTHFQGIDVMRINNIQKSLKLSATNLKWHKIQDLPIHYTDIVRPDQLQEMWDYNDNDVLITEALYNKTCDPNNDKIKLRYDLSEEYGINLLNESEAGIFNKLFDKLYSEASGIPIIELQQMRTKREIVLLKDVILSKIQFQDEQLITFLNDILELGVDCTLDKLKLPLPELNYRNVILQFGAGGIHSVDAGGVFVSNDEYDILDQDVASLYPAGIINYDAYPEHLGSEFITIYDNIRGRRIAAKRSGNKSIDGGFKLVLNIAYGKMNSKFHWMYDPKAALKVTVNNQLFILMLIEKYILNGIEVISANTDGVTCKVRKDQRDLYNSINAEWCKYTQYELEESHYAIYVRRDVNNYLAKFMEGKVKYKGKFNPELYKDLMKAFVMPIVPIALSQFYLEGIPIEDTIKNHKDIYDFCSAVKVGKSYSGVEYHLPPISDETVVRELQRSVRFYVTTNGGYLFKRKPIHTEGFWDMTDNDTPYWVPPSDRETLNAISSGNQVTIFNDYFEADDYQINYDYYIEEVNKIIASIENRKYISPSKLEEKIIKVEESLIKVNNKLLDWEEKNKTHLKQYSITKTRQEKLVIELENLLKLRR
jgi:hypothetical protein